MIGVTALLRHRIIRRNLLLLERKLLRDHCLLFANVSIHFPRVNMFEAGNSCLHELVDFVDELSWLPAVPPVVVRPGSTGSC